MSAIVILGTVIGAGVVLVGLIRLKNMKSWGRHDAQDEIDVQSRIVLITGASSGIGKEVAIEMLRRGAVVVIPCRTTERALATVTDLKGRPGTSNGTIVPMEMDMTSLESIRTFADAFKQRFDRVDILINNAGVFIPYQKRWVTKDGFEYNLGVNYISHFLLTELLLDHCKAAASSGEPSRILNVASSLHEKGELRLDDLSLTKLSPDEAKSIDPMKPYRNSKLAQVYFSQELGKRQSMTGVHTYALCPGWVYTGLGRNMDWKFYHYLGLLPVATMFMRTPHQGCQTILHCALSKQCGTETGKLYRNCKIWRSSALPLSEAKAALLWEKTVEMIG